MATASHIRAETLCYHSISQAWQGRLLMNSRWLSIQLMQRFNVINVHIQHLSLPLQDIPELCTVDTLQRLECWRRGTTNKADGHEAMPASLKLGVYVHPVESWRKHFHEHNCFLHCKYKCHWGELGCLDWMLRAVCRLRKMFPLPTFACFVYPDVKMCWVGMYLITCVGNLEKEDLRWHPNNRDRQGSLSGFTLDSLFKYCLPPFRQETFSERFLIFRTLFLQQQVNASRHPVAGERPRYYRSGNSFNGFK